MLCSPPNSTFVLPIQAIRRMLQRHLWRKALAEAAVAQGLSLVPGANGGAAPAVLRKWRAKLGYSDTGALAHAMESNAPSWVSVDGNELCVEVRQRAHGSLTLKGGTSLRAQARSHDSSGRPWKVEASFPFLYNWKVGSLDTECSSANASLSSASILT